MSDQPKPAPDTTAPTPPQPPPVPVPLLDRLTEGRALPDGFDRWGMKTVDGLRRTANKFHWPAPGQAARAWDDGEHDLTGVCPDRPGDGLTVALNVAEMSSGGLQVHAVLLVAYRQADVVAETSGKVRTSGDVLVVDEWLIKEIDLQGAYLQGAYLRGAYLRGAYLRGAYLQGADLQGADLQGADLQGADLQGALFGPGTTWPAGYDVAASGAREVKW